MHIEAHTRSGHSASLTDFLREVAPNANAMQSAIVRRQVKARLGTSCQWIHIEIIHALSTRKRMNSELLSKEIRKGQMIVAKALHKLTNAGILHSEFKDDVVVFSLSPEKIQRSSVIHKDAEKSEPEEEGKEEKYESDYLYEISDKKMEVDLDMRKIVKRLVKRMPTERHKQIFLSELWTTETAKFLEEELKDGVSVEECIRSLETSMRERCPDIAIHWRY